MKQKLLLTGYLCAAFSCAKAQTPHFEWAKNMGGTSSWSEGISIATDLSGNTYTTGHFSQTVDFDPGPGTFKMNAVGDEDIFIAKLDASGNLVWAKHMGAKIGTPSSTIGNAIAVDSKGNVYTTGSFEGTVDFDPGPSVYNLTATGSSSMFICKLDSAGNFIWAKSMTDTKLSAGNSITVDTLGNIYTTGHFYGTLHYDTGVTTLSMTSTGSADIFISKRDSSGNLVWARQIGGDSLDIASTIALDNKGNVYTTGAFYDTVDFDPGTGIYMLSVTWHYGMFISKLDNSGNFVWAKQFAGSSYIAGPSITIDRFGNVYTTGYFNETVDFDPNVGVYNLTTTGSNADIFVSKLDASGNFVWVQQFKESNYGAGKAIKTDASGNVYTTGYFLGTTDFDPGSSTFNLTSMSSSTDVFIVKLDSSGNFTWAKSMGGSDKDYGLSIAIDASDNIYTTGGFSGTVDFDPDAGVYNLTATNTGDIFVHKISQNTTGIDNTNNAAIGNIYPNPTDGIIQIETGAAVNNDINIQVFNSLGQMLINKSTKTHGIVSLDLHTYPIGLYHIKITDKNEILAQKSIIKQ